MCYVKAKIISVNNKMSYETIALFISLLSCFIAFVSAYYSRISKDEKLLKIDFGSKNYSGNIPEKELIVIWGKYCDSQDNSSTSRNHKCCQ